MFGGRHRIRRSLRQILPGKIAAHRNDGIVLSGTVPVPNVCSAHWTWQRYAPERVSNPMSWAVPQVMPKVRFAEMNGAVENHTHPPAQRWQHVTGGHQQTDLHAMFQLAIFWSNINTGAVLFGFNVGSAGGLLIEALNKRGAYWRNRN